MFFETYNAYVHIDIKTVTLANLGDFTKIFSLVIIKTATKETLLLKVKIHALTKDIYHLLHEKLVRKNMLNLLYYYSL